MIEGKLTQPTQVRHTVDICCAGWKRQNTFKVSHFIMVVQKLY